MRDVLLYGLLLAVGIALIIGAATSYALSSLREPTRQRSGRLTEAEHQDILAEKYKGKKEVRLDDGTRVDLLTKDEAIEIDFAKKWAEGIGQALYYGLKTGKKPAVILLVAKGEERYVKRLQLVANRYRIKVYIEPVKYWEKK